MIDDFFAEIFSLTESGRKADDIDDDRPPARDGFPEGKMKKRFLNSRERNPDLIREAKRLAILRHGHLKCARCGFEFALVYGRVGTGFIEAHHTKPLSRLHRDGDVTRVEDIAFK